MSIRVTTQNPYAPNKAFVPRLENGDRLTREEFHRRYEAMPENVKAELVKGIVYMASPVSVAHGTAHAQIMGFLGMYQMSTVGIVSVDNGTYIAGDDYEPQPDAVMRIDERFGGNSWVNEDGYLEGSPEMVVEIASSSVSYDLHDKLEMYEKKRVQEYIVWRVLDGQMDWFCLTNDKFRKLLPDDKGLLESRVFPGLRLDLHAMLHDDPPAIIAALKEGMASEAYSNFANSLEKRDSRR